MAVVLDLFSRRVVGWSMSRTMTAELVTDALMMAVWRRGWPRELLHHSDRGSEGFYNPRRRHPTLGYLSPIAFEERQRLV